MNQLLNKKTAVFISIVYFIFLSKMTQMDKLTFLMILLTAGIFVLFSVAYNLLGLTISFLAMNAFCDLIPVQFSAATFINKTWDFGFLLFFTFGIFIFWNHYKKLSTIKLPTYYKIFMVFLIVCLISFLLTLLRYPYQFVDSLRTFRHFLGYLFTPVLLLYFLKSKKEDCIENLNKFLNVLYIISFILLCFYNVQFVLNKTIFLGYSSEYFYNNINYIRSLPSFLFFCFFYLWFNILAWFTNNKLYPGGKIYIVICLTAALFTFTRGIYISVSISLILIIILLVKSRIKFNPTNIIIAFFIGALLLTSAYMTGGLKPFIARSSTIGKSLSAKSQTSNFWYRINLVSDRMKLIREGKNWMGLGFVHNKYGSNFGYFRGNYDKEINGPSLFCADIAWGNIVYQTGWVGLFVFTGFFFFLFHYYFTIIRRKNRLDRIYLLHIASLIELLRFAIETVNSSVYTHSTQNMALFFAINLFTYTLLSPTKQSDALST